MNSSALPEDMTQPIPMTDHVALAVLTTQMGHIKEAVDRIEGYAKENVPHSAWTQRNQYVDDKFLQTLGAISAVKEDVVKDIAEIKKDNAKAVAEIWSEIKSKRVPWTSIAALLVAGLLGLFEMIDRIGGNIQ